MSAVDDTVTVTEFLTVRELLAEKLKEDSQTQKPTRIKQAEALLAAGFIDIRTVLGGQNNGEVVYAAIES